MAFCEGIIMILKFKKLHENSIIPKKQTEDAAGFDLCYCPENGEDLVLKANSSALVPTGIAAEVPQGYYLAVCSRSGLALKNNVFVLNAPGVCDSGYRGEIGVILFNMGKEDFTIKAGNRIAQLLVCGEPTVSVKIAKKLCDTARGTGGFGSTGI